jgi:chorismate mutase
MTSTVDSFVTTTRDEIAALDVRLIETINARIGKVADLRRYKEEHGISFVDPEREAWLLGYLKGENRGPLSEEGVEELVTFVLDLVKREVARG